MNCYIYFHQKDIFIYFWCLFPLKLWTKFRKRERDRNIITKEISFNGNNIHYLIIIINSIMFFLELYMPNDELK